MDLGDAEQHRRWLAHLGGLVAGRKVVFGVAPLAAMTEWVDLLAAAGAEKPLLLATGVGAGPVPALDAGHVVMLRAERHSSMTEEIRGHDHLVRHLPERVRRAVDEYDPDGSSLWCVGPFIDNAPIEGRGVVGGRPAAWTALEDKLVVHDVWARVGYPQSPSTAVEMDLAQLRVVSHALDDGHGVVWSGDARDGINGGGDFVRWVRSDDEQAAAFEFFAPRCDRVRVMPFLEGVPCSIHGMVLPDGTAAFRPVELVVLRDDSRRFVYGGQGTFWDPPEVDREQMRELVRRTGEHLRDRVGYRGGFGIDGVLTKDGFRPTELNARMSAGLTSLARTVDVASFQLLQLNLSVGRDPVVSVAALEAWALPRMDANRFGKVLAIGDLRVVEEAQQISVCWDGIELRRTDDEAPLSLMVAPSPVGTFAKLDLHDGLPRGSLVAPLNAALMRFLDTELGTRFGTVEAAPDVR